MQLDLNRKDSLTAQQRKMEGTIPVLPSQSGMATLQLPDGQSIQLPVYQGSKGQPMIDVTSLYAKTGYFTIDPGFNVTGACLSTITYIDGDKGELLYRGYSIEDLARNSTYMEVCYLLIYGELPSEPELKKFEETMVSEMMINEKLIEFYKGFTSDSHPMAIMVGVVGALSAFMHNDFDVNDPRDREYIAIKLVAKMPTLAALAYRTALGLPVVYPLKKYSFIENFLYMMFSNPMEEFKCDPVLVRALDVIFILHADHEQNASTSTVRIAGSSLANPFACIAAGITALWGPMHGGANEAVLKMLKEIGTKNNVASCIEKAKDKNSGFRLMGFGHRVYKNYDPRAKMMQEMCYSVLKTTKRANEILDLAIELEQAALKDEYFIKRKLYPNVDFYTGIVYEALSIPTSMFTVMFAVQRSIGWICQWSEMMSEKAHRISRPRQLYVGEPDRAYVPANKRPKEDKSRICNLPMYSQLFKLMHQHGPKCGCAEYLGNEIADDLFSSIDFEEVICLNELDNNLKRVLLHEVDKLQKVHYIESDVDSEFIVVIPFIETVRIKSINIISHSEQSSANNLKVYINVPNVDFEIINMTPLEECLLGPNLDGEYPIAVKVNKFENVNQLILYIKGDNDPIRISYIGIKGIKTELKKKLANTTYELIPLPKETDPTKDVQMMIQ